MCRTWQKEKKNYGPRKLFFHGSGNCMQDLGMENNVFLKNMCFLENPFGDFYQNDCLQVKCKEDSENLLCVVQTMP